MPACSWHVCITNLASRSQGEFFPPRLAVFCQKREKLVCVMSYCEFTIDWWIRRDSFAVVSVIVEKKSPDAWRLLPTSCPNVSCPYFLNSYFINSSGFLFIAREPKSSTFNSSHANDLIFRQNTTFVLFLTALNTLEESSRDTPLIWALFPHFHGMRTSGRDVWQ